MWPAAKQNQTLTFWRGASICVWGLLVLELALTGSQEHWRFISLHPPPSLFSDSCCSLKLAMGRVFIPWKLGNSGNQGLFFFPRDSCQTFTNIPLGAWIRNKCMVFKNVPLIILKETSRDIRDEYNPFGLALLVFFSYYCFVTESLS